MRIREKAGLSRHIPSPHQANPNAFRYQLPGTDPSILFWKQLKKQAKRGQRSDKERQRATRVTEKRQRATKSYKAAIGKLLGNYREKEIDIEENEKDFWSADPVFGPVCGLIFRICGDRGASGVDDGHKVSWRGEKERRQCRQ